MKVRYLGTLMRPPGEEADEWRDAVNMWASTKFDSPQAVLDNLRTTQGPYVSTPEERRQQREENARETSAEELAAWAESDWDLALEMQDCLDHPEWGYVEESYSAKIGSPISHLVLAYLEDWEDLEQVITACGWWFPIAGVTEPYDKIPETNRLCKRCAQYIVDES